MTPCKPCERKGIQCHRGTQDFREIDPVPFSFETVDIFSKGTTLAMHFRITADFSRPSW